MRFREVNKVISGHKSRHYKNLIIRLLESSTRLDANGNKNIIFDLNGQLRQVLVKDNQFKSTYKPNAKATGTNQVGSPLQGKISTILVKEGDQVVERTPLFVIEAMKMETSVNSIRTGKITKIHLKQGSMVDQDDLILEIG